MSLDSNYYCEKYKRKLDDLDQTILKLKKHFEENKIR